LLLQHQPTGGSDGGSKEENRARARARLAAGGQDYEVRYESKKTGWSAAAVKKVGNARKRVDKRLGR
jgi:Protein of unknown function (DUF3606)